MMEFFHEDAGLVCVYFCVCRGINLSLESLRNVRIGNHLYSNYFSTLTILSATLEVPHST